MRALQRGLPGLWRWRCSPPARSRPKFETPRLSVVDVQLSSSDLWQQRLRVRMRVQNPNDRALAVRGLTYTLEVAGRAVRQR